MSSVKDTYTISDNNLFSGVASNISFKPISKNFENYNEGDIIYRSGDQSEYFYLIIEGEIKIKFSGARGKDFISKSKKEFFGEKELLEGSDRQSSAVANTDCILYKLKSKELKKLIEKFSVVKNNLKNFNYSDYKNGNGNSPESDNVNNLPFDLEKDTIKIKDFTAPKTKPIEKDDKKKNKDKFDESSKEELTELPKTNDFDEEIKKINFDLNFNTDSVNYDNFENEEETVVPEEPDETENSAEPEDIIESEDLVESDNLPEPDDSLELDDSVEFDDSLEPEDSVELEDSVSLEDFENTDSKEKDFLELEETQTIPPLDEKIVNPELEEESPIEFEGAAQVLEEGLDSTKLQAMLKESKKLIYATNIAEVGNAIIDLAIKSTNAEFGWVYILSRSNSIDNALKYIGSYSISLNLEVSEEISKQAIINNETVNLKDLEQDIRFNPQDTERNFLITSFLAIPIFNEVGMPLAVINLINNFKNAFSSADQELLTLVSDNFSAAIEKANAIEKLTMNSNADNIKKIASLLQNDIKTPVLTIKHYASLLKKKIDDEEVARILELISRHADSIQGMLQTTFDFSFNEIDMETHLMSFSKVMDGVLELLSDYVESRNVKLYKKFEEDAEVNIEKNLFFQACFQIAKNACDAMPYGGDLYVSTYLGNDLLKLEFKDEGTGIDNDIKERIFDPYFTYNKIDAGGLGLTIAKGIVKAHGGKIEVHSTPGEGSTFTISLPIAG